jgi:hypothetical protein
LLRTSSIQRHLLFVKTHMISNLFRTQNHIDKARRCSSIAILGRYCCPYQAGARGGSFQHSSQSRSALHDFNTKCEVQPPDRHGLWFRMLFSFSLHHSYHSYYGSSNISTRLLNVHSHGTVNGLLTVGYHYQTAATMSHEPSVFVGIVYVFRFLILLVTVAA